MLKLNISSAFVIGKSSGNTVEMTEFGTSLITLKNAFLLQKSFFLSKTTRKFLVF